ncbi:thioredoxin-related transmembrane protein 1-like [Montipora capricornis]|uniref:thioredoxin-related transmembrane protein 1-like n=1 Tax=Montipora capricornis TaxID=246305 RepID=UPI0035F1891E
MASNLAAQNFVVFVIGFLLCPGCLAGENEQLSYENWDKMLQGEWMVKFFAPWCPACQRVASVWTSLALKAEKLGINVAEVDTSKETALSGRFMIFSLPTIYHVKNGEFRKYEGPRSLQAFTDFIKEQKWREIEPLPWWKSPSSFLMWCLGMTFKLSLFLKDMHELITVTYGLPEWASYTIFGVSTVLTGLILGMVIVLVSDKILGGPSVIQPSKPAKKKPEEEPGEEHEHKDEQEKTEDLAQDIDTDETSVRKRVVATTE